MTTVNPDSNTLVGNPDGNRSVATSKKPESPTALAYRINDFAKAVGIGRTSVYKLIAEGKIRPIKIAGRVLIPADEFSRLLRESGASR